jgi:hypothetical protein
MCLKRDVSILEGMVGAAVPQMSPDETQAVWTELHRQVGQLEGRNAALEQVIKTLCRRCALRGWGVCALNCAGRDFVDTEGLVVLQFQPKAVEYEREICQPGS